MRRVVSALLAVFALSASLSAGGLKKGAAYGHYDTAFDKVATEIALNRSTDQLHSLVVLKGGELIYQYHDPAHSMKQRHVLWSASKSFTALALGFAIQDGLLSLEDKVVDFFPEAVPAGADPRLAQVSVRDLLVMASGFGKDFIGELRSGMKDVAATLFTQPFKFDPGSRYEYNSTNTYLLGVIVSDVTGKALDDYLAEKLFKPLGIRDWYWEKSAEGYCFGGWGLFLSPESLAKAGQFLLQKGQWKGRQLLNAAYIEEATAKQIEQYVPGGGGIGPHQRLLPGLRIPVLALHARRLPDVRRLRSVGDRHSGQRCGHRSHLLQYGRPETDGPCLEIRVSEFIILIIKICQQEENLSSRSPWPAPHSPSATSWKRWGR